MTKTFISLLSITFFCTASVSAQYLNVTNDDSIVSLATNVTKNYTFTDTNGLSVVVAVTMTPHSDETNNPVFTLLDFDSGTGAYRHLGVDSGTGSGDGNWVDPSEGMDFSAMLVSASPGVITNSVQFGVMGLGFRSDAGYPIINWDSSAFSSSFTPDSDGLYVLDTILTGLTGTTYSGQVRSGSAGLYQLNDADPIAGQSIVFQVSFVEGDGAPVVTLNPSNQTVCENDGVMLTAAATGDPIPTVQWQVKTNGGSSFDDIPDATDTTLMLTPAATADGNQYRATFTNSNGSTNTVVATLTVIAAPVAIISTPDNVSAHSTNTATATAGAASYSWSIVNGIIISPTNTPTITYVASEFGDITLNLTVANISGCLTSTSTNISGPTGGIYVSDSSHIVEKLDGSGDATIFTGTFFLPCGIAFDKSTNLFVIGDNGSVQEYDTDGNGSTFAFALAAPYVLAFDGAGFLYVGNWDGTIIKFAPDGSSSTFADGVVNSPNGMAFDSAGNLYVSDYNENEIIKFTPDGSHSVFAGLNGPAGLAFDTSGNLFAADFNDGEIWKFDANGNGSLFATDNLQSPNALAFDGDGNLYVGDWEGAIVKFTPAGSSSIFSTENLHEPQAIAVWPIPSQLIPSGATAPTFSSFNFTNDQFQFLVSGTTGGNYIVQATTNLAAPNWVSISTNATPFIFTESNFSSYPQRFYRAVSQ